MALRDIRGGQVRLRDLPDLPQFKREKDKYDEMLAELDSARRKIRELEASRPQAKQQDRDKYARVILQKGAKAPDQPSAEQAKLEEQIAKAGARRDAAETALDLAEEKLIRAVEGKRAQLLHDIDVLLEAVAHDYAGAVEKLIAIRAGRDERLNLRAWVAGFPEQTVEVRKTSRPFFGIKTANGSPVSSVTLAQALREDVEGPPKPNTMPRPEEAVSDAA
jgi:hypothetical protein